MNPSFIYFDNASTSHPKPSVLWKSAKNYIENIGASPGRSGHARTKQAEEAVTQTRVLLSRLFHSKDINSIFFALNATQALNIVIKGFLKKGDHVVTTNLEHTSVLRPLEKLKREGLITYDIVSSDPDGLFEIDHFKHALQKNTKLIAVNHASNVLGVISPIQEIGKIAHDNGIKMLVDATQTAGLFDIDVERDCIDFLAFTGHKGLLGPSGTGGAYIEDSTLVDTLYEGGTGNSSHSLLQPEDPPLKFEAGTLNYMGIVGLGGSLEFLFQKSIEKLREKELNLTEYCLKNLSEIEDVTVYGTMNSQYKTPIISFNLKGLFSNELAHILDDRYNIMIRAGLQCAPLIHKTIGTFPHGTARISFGAENTLQEVECFVKCLEELRNKWTI